MRSEVLLWLSDTDYIDELKQYIQLPSRSRRKEEVKKCGEMAISLLQSCGLDVSSHPTTGNDIIIAQSLCGADKPTILIYGHYDVQPEGDLEEWDSDPFEPVIRGDKLFGRGTADNKGQHYAYILALRYLREFNPEVFEMVNIKIILDGDEELGSFSLPEVVERYSDKLSCDFVYVSDGPSLSTESPTIVCSVRGILDFQLIIKHNQSDLHSGNFGGIARSASRDLVSLLNSLSDERGRVLIDGFYDDVNKPLDTEKSALSQLDDVYGSITDNYQITLAPTHSDLSNPGLNQFFPTLNINGIRTGGIKDERRTIIPSEAVASIDCRLVPNQEPDKIQKLLEDHIHAKAEELGISDAVSIEFGHAMNPMKSSINCEYMDLVKDATINGFGSEPLIVPRLGGSLPIYLFSKFLNKPVILVPLSHPDSKNHAPNENLDLPYFESGVATMVHLLKNFGNTIGKGNL